MKKYIITFAEGVNSPEEAEAVFSAANLELTASTDANSDKAASDNDSFIFLEALGIAIVSLEEGGVSVLRDAESVLSVEENGEVQALGTEQVTEAPHIMHPHGARWNMNLVRADSVWKAGTFGTGIKVGILDTGIAAHPNLRTHGGISFIPGNGSYRDDNGHGTHCAGIVAGKGRNNVFGVSPGAELYSVKVLDQAGNGTWDWVLAGMNWCVRAGINVVSMSLGGTSGPIQSFAQATKRCQSNGIIVVCAAGNSGNTTFPWVNAPANSFKRGDILSSPVAVASVDQSKVIAPSSSRGTNGDDWNGVTLSAPGVAILSTHLNAGYRTLSGTSMACPHVAGLCALIMERNGPLSVPLIKALMTTSAEQLGVTPTPNDAYGYGLIDCANATGVISARMTEVLKDVEPA